MKKLKKSPTNTIKARLDSYSPIDVPYNVWTKFGEKSKQVLIAGDQVSLGEDYASLEQAQEAIEWYVNQLGGKVEWSK